MKITIRASQSTESFSYKGTKIYNKDGYYYIYEGAKGTDKVEFESEKEAKAYIDDNKDDIKAASMPKELKYYRKATDEDEGMSEEDIAEIKEVCEENGYKHIAEYIAKDKYYDKLANDNQEYASLVEDDHGKRQLVFIIDDRLIPVSIKASNVLASEEIAYVVSYTEEDGDIESGPSYTDVYDIIFAKDRNEAEQIAESRFGGWVPYQVIGEATPEDLKEYYEPDFDDFID